jgi:hypothetical protein
MAYEICAKNWGITTSNLSAMKIHPPSIPAHDRLFLCPVPLPKPSQISHSSSRQQGNMIELMARVVLGQEISLAEVLFTGKTRTKQIA